MRGAKNSYYELLSPVTRPGGARSHTGVRVSMADTRRLSPARRQCFGGRSMRRRTPGRGRLGSDGSRAACAAGSRMWGAPLAAARGDFDGSWSVSEPLPRPPTGMQRGSSLPRHHRIGPLLPGMSVASAMCPLAVRVCPECGSGASDPRTSAATHMHSSACAEGGAPHSSVTKAKLANAMRRIMKARGLGARVAEVYRSPAPGQGASGAPGEKGAEGGGAGGGGCRALGGGEDGDGRRRRLLFPRLPPVSTSGRRFYSACPWCAVGTATRSGKPGTSRPSSGASPSSPPSRSRARPT